MMQSIAILVLAGLSFLAGAFCFFGYMIWRMMRNDGWTGDDSNINNAQRILSHVVLHTEDFSKMYYLTDNQVVDILDAFPDWELQRPFWYVTEDEFEGVVRTRPR